MLILSDGKVEHVVAVKKEPEGVAFAPDGKFVYVTCETHGEVFVIDAATNKSVAEIAVGGRPRTVAFLPDGSRAFVPSESAGTICRAAWGRPARSGSATAGGIPGASRPRIAH